MEHKMLKLDEIILGSLFEYNQKLFDKLKNTINDKNFNFILGAGVSMSLGYPGWGNVISQTIGNLLPQFLGSRNGDEQISIELEELIGKVLKYDSRLFGENKKIVKGANGGYSHIINGTDLLEAAEYIYNYIYEFVESGSRDIKHGISERKLLTLIRRAMFTPETKLNKTLDEKYEKSTIRAVAQTVKGLYGSSKIQQDVITYNYDNLLEYCLINREGLDAGDINSISHTDKDKIPKDNKINIFHVHGKFNVHNLEDASENIILSESSYHSIEKQDYLWSHTVQANAMLNKTCLFVGFSAQDYNFRRIARNMDSVENIYILFTVDELVKTVFGDIIKKKYNEDCIRKIALGRYLGTTKMNIAKLCPHDVPEKEFNRLLKDILNKEEYSYEKLLLTFLIYSHTKYWQNMNINPIWTTINELPGIINKLN